MSNPVLQVIAGCCDMCYGCSGPVPEQILVTLSGTTSPPASSIVVDMGDQWTPRTRQITNRSITIPTAFVLTRDRTMGMNCRWIADDFGTWSAGMHYEYTYAGVHYFSDSTFGGSLRAVLTIRPGGSVRFQITASSTVEDVVLAYYSGGDIGGFAESIWCEVWDSEVDVSGDCWPFAAHASDALDDFVVRSEWWASEYGYEGHFVGEYEFALAIGGAATFSKWTG